VGFEQAGQTVTMTISDKRWPDGKTIPIARESTGFITALLHLCALASTEHDGLITLDEIETSLHPRAIRILIEAMRLRAASHNLRIILATQSETVLDQFRDDPSHVFVLEPNQDRSPKALTELFSPEYLSQFSLGDLFAHLEFGGENPTDA
jgi:predicted ATPase